jgi:hypothetical protein
LRLDKFERAAMYTQVMQTLGGALDLFQGKDSRLLLACRHDLHRATPKEDIDHHLQPRAAQGDIDGRSIKGEIAERNLAKKVRQHGSLESDLRPVAVETVSAGRKLPKSAE